MSQAELARRGDLSPSQVSKILNMQSTPGESALSGIAKALDLPLDMVFREAGLLPPQSDILDELDEFAHLYQQLNQADRNDLIEIARLKAARGKK
ncbi:MAG: helix-turn-helix transcriptional regulator [Chloroflexi bacterium]|nr:helix-turn-helix transcriptional regulator [Chloroflexota bacterium]